MSFVFSSLIPAFVFVSYVRTSPIKDSISLIPCLNRALRASNDTHEFWIPWFMSSNRSIDVDADDDRQKKQLWSRMETVERSTTYVLVLPCRRTPPPPRKGSYVQYRAAPKAKQLTSRDSVDVHMAGDKLASTCGRLATTLSYGVM